MTAPIALRYEGDGAFSAASRRFAREADRTYVVGDVYTLVAHEERSAVSHRHYFAAVNEAWKSLPERLSGEFPTPEHLRKWALIKAGYRDERSIVCSSRAEAQRVAAFVKPMDEFAVVTVSDAVVRVYTARSQSHRAMSRQDFQASKDAVLGVLADMIGVDAGDLARQGEAA